MYTYDHKVLKTILEKPTLMCLCVDHAATFTDTHSKVWPDNLIYGSKVIVLARPQPNKYNFQIKTYVRIRSLWILNILVCGEVL